MIYDIAKTIRAYRKAAGLSQKALADLAEIGKTTVFDLEKGKETVQIKSLLKILTVLNIQLKLEGPFSIEAEK